MADQILLGKNGNQHGIWVAKPNQSVQQGGQMLMSSVQDMLKIHAQGKKTSTSIRQSQGLWRHSIIVDFPELPFIPLAFMGFVNTGSEPFSFPPNLGDIVTWENFPSRGIVNYIPAVGISHNQLKFEGWTFDKVSNFNYIVFLTKLRDKF
ncbi:hypothetical protein ACI0FM_08730 [Paenochrobactrum sp. BZR 588]|uniref:hypothetical protein n=1 Tax=unclassified Paenochrobactrum TaxID=2639760 RepID=UPI0038530362